MKLTLLTLTLALISAPLCAENSRPPRPIPAPDFSTLPDELQEIIENLAEHEGNARQMAQLFPEQAAAFKARADTFRDAQMTVFYVHAARTPIPPKPKPVPVNGRIPFRRR